MKEPIIYHGQGWLFRRLAAIIFAFGIAPYLLLRYSGSFGQWIDETFRKSEQYQAGIVLLCIFIPVFIVLVVYVKAKR